MKLIAIVVLLSCSAAFADPAPDAPLKAPDRPGVSVHLLQGQLAPFTGRLLSDAEHLKSEKFETKIDVSTSSAKTDGVLLPKPVFVTLIAGVIVVIAGGIAATACAASHCIPQSK